MFVKICGLSSAEAVAAAVEAGADAVGFVIAPSTRQVSVHTAARLAEPARGKAWCIAVTRHPNASQVEEILDVFAPDLLQTDQNDLAALPERARDRMLAVYRENEQIPEKLPPCILFEGAQSGVGQTANWALAQTLALRTRLLLAGGLDVQNVAAAIRRVRPWGVDVSSGVESAPGIKSPQKIHEFVKAANAAFGELSE
ncbi:MAG: phosphoribosylanthranilate isomerase [Gammaproteobacteria bacterium]